MRDRAAGSSQMYYLSKGEVCFMDSPKNMRNKAEIVVISEFIKNDIPVSIPFGQNEPYDLVIDTKYGFKSVQVKHGTYRNGCVVVDIRHRIGYSKIEYSTYDGKADYIAIWCEELNTCYLLDIKECNGKTNLRLRIDNPKNNSCISTIVWAKDYEFSNKVLLLK